MTAGGEFTASYPETTEALKTLALANGKQAATPATEHVRATVKDTAVELVSFDYETAVTVTLDAIDTTPGVMLIHRDTLTKTLAAAVKGTTKAQEARLTVRIECTSEDVVAHVGGYGIPLISSGKPINVSDFPNPPAMSIPNYVVDRAEFTELSNRVALVVDRSGTLPTLEGVNIEFDGRAGEASMTATDRYRLARGVVKVDSATMESVGIVVPGVQLGKVLARLTGDHLSVGVDHGAYEGWLTLSDQTTTVQLKGTAGDYPKVASILNSRSTRTVTLDRTELTQAVIRGAALSKASGAKNQPMVLAADSDTLTVLPSTTGDRSKVKAPALAAQIEGETGPWTGGVNPEYLLDVMKTLTSDRVTLSLGEAMAPVLFTNDDDSLDEYKHLLMQIRL